MKQPDTGLCILCIRRMRIYRNLKQKIKFKQVVKVTKAKFSRSIKYLRLDRGIEYVNEQFTTYMRENGIEI